MPIIITYVSVAVNHKKGNRRPINKNRNKLVALTAINYFAKEVLAALEILCRAVPPAVPELVLALGDGHVSATDQRSQHTWVLTDQSSLLPAQGRVDGRVHVHHCFRVQWRNVVGLSHLGDAPVTEKKEGMHCNEYVVVLIIFKAQE